MSPLERYWKIYHTPDLNETGSPTEVTYVKTIWEGFPTQQQCEKEILQDWCRDRFGCEVVYVQGVAATQNWIVCESDIITFERAQPIKWGGYLTQTTIVRLGIGDHGKITTFPVHVSFSVRVD